MKIRLELVYPVFLKCCKYSDDIFWKFIFEDLAYGKAPYGTYITKNFLCCNYKDKQFSYKIDPKKDPKIIYENIHKLLFNKFGLMSQTDKENRRLIFENTKNNIEQICKSDWNMIKKKNIKNILIENFVIDMKNKHNLSDKLCKKLLSIIKIGIIFKTILSDDIKYKDGKINNIEGIVFNNKKIKFNKNIYKSSNKISSQIIIEKKSNISENWPKFLLNLQKK